MIVLREEPYVHGNGHVHQALDLFPWGVDKLGLIQDLRVIGDLEEFVIPFVKYHSRWKDLRKYDFRYACERTLFEDKGYNLLTLNKTKNANRSYDLEKTDRRRICRENLYWLERINSLVRAKGVRLVLVSVPLQYEINGLGRLAALHDWAKANGVDFIDLNLHFDETTICPASDFWDRGHLNVLGAEKATRYIGGHLAKLCQHDKRVFDDGSAGWWSSEVLRYGRSCLKFHKVKPAK